MKRLLLVVLALVVLLSGCVTNTMVRFNSSEPGTELYIDNQLVGTTPHTEQLSNAVWEDPVIVYRKAGYQEIMTTLDKEVKMVNLVCGILLWWPSLLWVYGPEPVQNVTLVGE
jgi:hypothetical protein